MLASFHFQWFYGICCSCSWSINIFSHLRWIFCVKYLQWFEGWLLFFFLKDLTHYPPSSELWAYWSMRSIMRKLEGQLVTLEYTPWNVEFHLVDMFHPIIVLALSLTLFMDWPLHSVCHKTPPIWLFLLPYLKLYPPSPPFRLFLFYVVRCMNHPLLILSF